MSLTISLAVGPTVPEILDITVGDALRVAAENVPERLAIIEGLHDASARRQWTYAELYAEAVRTARALLARFHVGDHISVWAHNVPEWALLEFGCALAGMSIVTVNPALQASEVAYIVNQSSSVGLFLVDEHRGNPMLAIAGEVQANCPELREIVRIQEWDDFLAAGDDFSGDLPHVTPTDQVMLQYTSGTTGFPKGASLHHRGLLSNASHYFDRLGMQDGQVYITMMPLFHTAGSAMSMLGAVTRQCTQVLVPAFDAALVLRLIETYGVNGMMGVPTMMVGILSDPNFEDTDLSSLTALCSGGSLVPEQMVKTFEEKLGAPFTIVYGQTECSPVVNMTAPDDTIADKATTIGPPMPHVEVKIIDPESGETMPVGEVGELCSRGYHVMHGYYDLPEQTADTIDDDGWLRSGDLASMDERGYTMIEGRLKDMIIRGGENIYPKELEELLFGHDSVAEVAVVGLPDDKWGEIVGAFVRPAEGKSISKDELFSYLREHAAPHKTPKLWFEVEEFPLTGSGKIQKFKIRDMWVAGGWAEL
ncbi:MAG: fatty-acyl-CoA synthase [Verrucomicrobiales bacterium]|jgi:fatty-acyl-CoA synthase